MRFSVEFKEYYTYKPIYINPDFVAAIYSSREISPTCILLTGGKEVLVVESPEQVRDAIFPEVTAASLFGKII